MTPQPSLDDIEAIFADPTPQPSPAIVEPPKPTLALVPSSVETLGDEDEDLLEEQPFLCEADYHILKDAPPFADTIYNRARRLSYKTKQFYSSAEKVANFYDTNERTVRRCFRVLWTLDILRYLSTAPFASTRYRVLDHEEWAKKHPGQCRPKFEYVWAGEGDKLAQRLYSATGGRVKLYENQMVSVRKIMATANLSDDRLYEIFDAYYEESGKKHRNPKNVIPVFINWLKKQYKV